MDRDMHLFPRAIVVVSLIGLLFAMNVLPARSIVCEDSCDDKSGEERLTCFNEVKEACEAKLKETSEKKQTLESTIKYLDNQIAFTQSKINQTVYQIEQLEKQITTLLGKISVLNSNLETTTRLLLRRITATYKQTKIHPLTIFFSSNGISDIINRYRYLRAVQINDRRVLFDLEEARVVFDDQKTIKEGKQQVVLGLQTELLEQRAVQDHQKKEKQFLFDVTENDEKRYQELLKKARAELVAIQAIIAGQGDETEVGDVNEGEKIASIMTEGPNLFACSTGPHLHFEVAKDQTYQNPFNFLSNKSVIWDNADPQQNATGSWRWPLEDPIRITQGFGETSYSSRYAGGIHTGVDMVNNDNREVKAVRKGKLYRGSISCRGGTLQYVRVSHGEDEYDSYYLHVNYI